MPSCRQELDNDLSDMYPGSEVHQFRDTLRQKRSHSQQFASSRGKENACPAFASLLPPPPRRSPRGRSRYQTFFPLPTAPYFREHRAVSSVGKLDQSSSRSASRCKAYDRDNEPSNSRTLLHDLSISLEGEHQQWLTCTESDPRGGRSLADRERKTHLIKLKEEGKKAQSTVALHVE